MFKALYFSITAVMSVVFAQHQLPVCFTIMSLLWIGGIAREFTILSFRNTDDEGKEKSTYRK